MCPVQCVTYVSGRSKHANSPSKSVSPSTTHPASGQDRCSHFFPSGRRCRHAVSPGNPGFCLTHASKSACPNPRREPRFELLPTADEALAAELAAAAGDFSSPANVMQVMSRIFHALVQQRISAKEAGVLCYIAQTILHSHRAMAYQQKLENASQSRVFINDLPRPRRDDPAPRTFINDLPGPGRKDHIEDPDDLIVQEAQDPAAAAETSNPHATSVAANPSPKVLETPTSSTSPITSALKLPPPVVSPPPKPPDLNHFYPWDPTLPPGSQDPRKLIPPSDEAEIARRNARYDRRNGYRR